MKGGGGMRLNEIRLPDINGGINTHDPEYSIEDNQSPDMLNLWYKDKALRKRDGQTLEIGKENIYKISREFNGARAVHAGNRLYKWDGALTEILNGDNASVTINDAPGTFVEFGDKLYYMDGVEIWQISSAFKISAIDPYVPVVMINCLPDLSERTDNESYNLLTVGFCVHYHGDSSSPTYTLPHKSLVGEVKVVVDSYDLTENQDYTVDRTNGTVSFNNAPPEGTNNVWITAYEEHDSEAQAYKERITKCKVALPYGGESSGVDGGSRVFVMSNSDHPLRYWRSDLGLNQSYGMRYFPDTSEELLDQNSEAITAAAKMEGELIIFKTNSIFAVNYAFDGENVYYPVRECHTSIGCDMPGSLQLIDNKLVFCNSDAGVHMLIASSNSMENTVKPLSANINTLLLDESDLESACSVDYERYYWLKAGKRVYLWDYEQTPYTNYSDYEKAQRRLSWYVFDGIDANDFCNDGDQLYYGSNSGIVRFKRKMNDFGNAYNSYYYSKAFDLGCPNVYKTFMELYPSFIGDGNVKAVVSVGSDKKDEHITREIDLRSFGWDNLTWSAFTWHIIKFTKTFVMKLRMRKVQYLQVRVISDEKDRSFGLTGMRISYYLNRKIKR